MSSRRQRSIWPALAAIGVAAGGACTLSSDEFEPPLVTPELAQQNGAAGATPACAGPSCDDEGGGDDDPACAERGDCPEPTVARLPDAGLTCPAGRCEEDADCSTLSCRAGCCAEASCSDGVANGGESDADCGGGCAVRCAAGRVCRSASDCSPGVACPTSRGRCTPRACDNGILDGTEILPDCGGGECEGCLVGTACGSGVDCASGSCSEAGRCALPTCEDGARNQDELGVDCGGGCGLPCPAGSACTGGAGCTSNVCGGGGCTLASDTQCCQPASCADGVLNGGEVNVDCGSADPLCPRCEAGLLCQSDTQCASGVCEAGRCCGGTTGDCTRCAERLSPTLDCATAPPGGALNCAGFLQCLASNANVCTTRFASGCTNDPGGACNHNTYGGNDGLGVQHATRVLAEAGCTP